MNRHENRSDAVLEVEDLIVQYHTTSGVVEAVNGLSFSIGRGETLGLVGETGAGKTTVALSIIGLLPDIVSRVPRGSIRLNGEDLLQKSEKEMEGIRGKRISMIFQDPMTSLNPVLSIGSQIAEVVRIHERCSKAEAELKAIDMLNLVGIRAERYADYPHQFSGGMKQRVVIAMALACNPELLIADEPTTALDVTIQAQVLEMMRQLKNEFHTAMLMITHDLGVVAEICEKCAVIYAGEIVEAGTVRQLYDDPRHPYTRGLFASLPDLDSDVDRLYTIKGLMPNPEDLPPYCSFYERCDSASEACRTCGALPLVEVEPGHVVRCLLSKPAAGGEK